MHSQLEQNKEHSGWLRRSSNISLEEVNNSVKVPGNAGFWRKFFAFAGPGSLVAVGYVDPGNWATSIAGEPGLDIPCYS